MFYHLEKFNHFHNNLTDLTLQHLALLLYLNSNFLNQLQ